ncbi:MAG: amino acid permease [Spirochaetales bacterium]|nr:amino acid permease [Spirochaetales bacterium]
MTKKFGTFKGVFIPSTEAILGTVLFLLLPLLTADVGLIPVIFIIILAHTVTFSTAFSLSDCATNLNTISGGGMYALSKKSLGKAFGGSIGIQLFIAQAASIGFYCIGFIEPLQPIIAPLLQHIPFLSEVAGASALVQKQVLSSIIFIIFFIIVMIGADFTLKIQMMILFILASSIITIFISPLTNLYHNNKAVFETIPQINLLGNRPLTLGLFFFSFTQFFPAVTGIDAGVGMSGDLKDPRKSLVRGTFTAIIITFFVYLFSAFVYSLINKNVLITGYNGSGPLGILLTDLLGLKEQFPSNILGIIVLIGILFATSSSALSCFMTAPRTAQSLARDNLLPRAINFLKYDFIKRGNEPRFASLLTFVIGMSVIWIGNINIAAMIVGICYLIVYGWVNFAAFLERISGNPTFRPTSRGNWMISLYGFVSSLIAIILFNWLIGLIIFTSQFIIFKLILRYKSKKKLEGVWWGVVFEFMTRGLKSLKKIVQGAKNWRPIVTAIAFNGKKNCPQQIANLADKIASFKGLVNMNIIFSDQSEVEEFNATRYSIPLGFIVNSNPTSGILSSIQISHPGGIIPNTLLIEYEKELNTTKIVKTLLRLEKNILILKNGEHLSSFTHLDIWWKSEMNGNLMLFLAYIIYNSVSYISRQDITIRIIYVLEPEEKESDVLSEFKALLLKSRLKGDILLEPYSKEPIHKTIERVSENTSLILLGLPGTFIKEEKSKVFNFDEYFFDRELERYDNHPPILFVKSAKKISLVED